VSDQDGNENEIFRGVELGVGTWSWGDRMFWGYRQDYGLEDVKAAFQASLEGGLTFFDTAEVYGMGQSEKLLGSFLKASETLAHPVRVATKFFPFPWRLTGNALKRALKASLARLGLPQVDLYQVQFPNPPVRIETWMEAMAEACQAGLVKAVGVSNYNPDQTRRAYEALQHEGIRLASNQVEYHLLNRKIETSGLLKQCQDMEVKIIAYSPLAQGILTGKFSPENLPRGFRGQRYNRKMLERVAPLLSLLKKIGSDHGGKNAGQVALNWCICKGTLPIPGAKTLQQAEQNCSAAGWRLSENEIFLLDDVSQRISEE
jgi:aryl-alcohol dehydrogenase-like predicted oxidoreductase